MIKQRREPRVCALTAQRGPACSLGSEIEESASADDVYQEQVLKISLMFKGTRWSHCVRRSLARKKM